MTTVLSQKGQLVLPVPVREQLHLSPGDDFEVAIEDEDTITLRRISTPANHGLVDLLLACPAPFEIPPRERDDSLPLAL
jgi:AbrB family looped-hinge helix DNA binding protein